MSKDLPEDVGSRVSWDLRGINAWLWGSEFVLLSFNIQSRSLFSRKRPRFLVHAVLHSIFPKNAWKLDSCSLPCAFLLLQNHIHGLPMVGTRGYLTLRMFSKAIMTRKHDLQIGSRFLHVLSFPQLLSRSQIGTKTIELYNSCASPSLCVRNLHYTSPWTNTR